MNAPSVPKTSNIVCVFLCVCLFVCECVCLFVCECVCLMCVCVSGVCGV